jgi:hypothetical protein
LEDLTVAPGVAPWVGGRVGIEGSNEAGITYSGRSIRVDGRHAFGLGVPTLSIGLGASAIVADRPSNDSESSVYGGGADVPILIGVTSRNDIYSLWIGPRAGFELLSGRVETTELSSGPVEQAVVDADGKHIYVGALVGLRVGFRHIHVAIEVSGAYHHATGSLGDFSATLDQVSFTPAGALIVSF